MKKREKTIRVVVNGVLLAAIAALGITVYRTGGEEQEQRQRAQQELAMQQEFPEEHAVEETDEETVDVDTEQVEAQMTDDTDSEETAEIPEESAEDSEETAKIPEESEELPEETADAGADEAAEEPVSAIPTVNFTEDTLMIWPLAGDILLDYSMDRTVYHPTLDQYKYNPAIVVSAAVDSPVLAAANGTVTSIAENEETGTTVTLDMGNGYEAVYGQLQNIQVGEGQTVGESTILGYVAEPTKYYSVEGSNLYFAMRKDGAPLDPITYLP